MPGHKRVYKNILVHTIETNRDDVSVEFMDKGRGVWVNGDYIITKDYLKKK